MNLTRDSWRDILNDALNERRDAQLFREREIVHPIDATHVRIGDRILVNFCSNDYLGLTHHPKVLAAVSETISSHGYGAGAAGLISGYTDKHASAERAIAKWKDVPSAVLLPSGYQANLAAIQTLAALGDRYAGGVRFLVDKLAHASLIDAVRACSGEVDFRVFPHNGIAKLRRLLADAKTDQLQVVVTESIFSMDGDAADLATLAQLKSEFSFVVLLDEAHGGGVYGPSGAGLAAEENLQEIVDVSVITLSKSLGCVGGAVCGSIEFCEMLLNAGRAYIYSTSIPAVAAAAAEAAIEVCKREPERQRRVRELARRVRSELGVIGSQIESATARNDSPIVPILLGTESAAIEAASVLFKDGFLVTPVRPPTVAKGTSRLRVTLSSEHTDAEVAQLIDAIKHLN